MKYLIPVLLICLTSAASFAESNSKIQSIRYGVYKLKGTFPDGLTKYSGKIVFQREGPNYRVTWLLGPELIPSHTGIGIFQGGILSVSYLGLSGKDLGVVSYRIDPKVKGQLLGKWTSMLLRGEFGEEDLIFESDSVPDSLDPKKVKPASGSTDT